MIPADAFEAAARALATADGYTDHSWDKRAEAPEYGHGYYTNAARAALEAAAPHLGAALKDELRREGQHEAADIVGQFMGAP